MIQAVVMFKRGRHLSGTVYKDTSTPSSPYYAEINIDGEISKSVRYIDEDNAVNWIDEKFNEVVNRKMKRSTL